jgi:secondary thiamine-phosphate synthase enzyme
MTIKNKILNFQTEKIYHFIDFTSKVKEFVKETEVKDGIVNIQIFNTSAALILNENEPLLLKDIERKLEKLSPKNDNYEHNNLSKRTVNLCENECMNGHSHCNAINLPATITINIVNGQLQLGKWQSIMFLELDSARERKVQLQIMGK